MSESQCNGICVTGAELGVVGVDIAYPHPDCPMHSHQIADETEGKQ